MSQTGYITSDITSLLAAPIELMLNTNLIILEGSKRVDEGLNFMKEKNTRTILVSNGSEVIGIVTKTDILFKVIAQGKNPAKISLREIMSSPVVAVDSKDSVRQAVNTMDKHSVRQLIVSSDSSILGLVSREDIVEKIQQASMLADDNAFSGTPVCIINPKAIIFMKDKNTIRITCPYCESSFDTKESLMRHIPNAHQDLTIFERHMKNMFELGKSE
jgi:CBS domain-containing protein/uncharacterized C2H2 Zn-finger protein